MSRKEKENERYQTNNTVLKDMRNTQQRQIKCPHPSHLSQRKFVLRPQLCYTDSGTVYSHASRQKSETQQSASLVTLLETFTSLCVGPTAYERRPTRKIRKPTKHHVSRRKRVVYPIATYPHRLNSKTMIEQRRRSMQDHFFRPVIMEDEMRMLLAQR